MKRLFAICLLAVMLPLCACSEHTPYADMTMIGKRINTIYGDEVFTQATTTVRTADGRTTLYWMPPNVKNACVSFDLHPKTGHALTCSVVFLCGKADADPLLLRRMRQIFTENNPYVTQNEYAAEGCYLYRLADSRYEADDPTPTLKKEINPADLY